MRTSVLDTLLDTLRRNVARGSRDVAVYEVGLVTRALQRPRRAHRSPASSAPDDATLAAILGAVPPQPRHAAYAAAGEVEQGGPWGPGRKADTSDAVAWALAVGRSVGLDLVVTSVDRAPWHPGRCAQLALADGTVVGHAGELHPKVTGRTRAARAHRRG